VIIAGLTGGIGHGKTTFATLLAEQSRASVHFETWELVAEVAAILRDENPHHPDANDIPAINNWLFPLVDAVNLCTHVSISFADLKISDDRLANHPEYYSKLFEYLKAAREHPDRASAELTEETKHFFRPLLQWLGGYLVIVAGSGIWYDELVRRIAHQRSTGCDLVTVGGVRYPADAERLRNAGGVVLEIVRPDLPSTDVRDLTERDRNLICADSIITNNQDLDQLAAVAAVVYQDLSTRQLQPSYSASKA
jgi:hypothetical protein